jgi:hypothetical protein
VSDDWIFHLSLVALAVWAVVHHWRELKRQHREGYLAALVHVDEELRRGKDATEAVRKLREGE